MHFSRQTNGGGGFEPPNPPCVRPCCKVCQPLAIAATSLEIVDAEMDPGNSLSLLFHLNVFFRWKFVIFMGDSRIPSSLFTIRRTNAYAGSYGIETSMKRNAVAEATVCNNVNTIRNSLPLWLEGNFFWVDKELHVKQIRVTSFNQFFRSKLLNRLKNHRIQGRI